MTNKISLLLLSGLVLASGCAGDVSDASEDDPLEQGASAESPSDTAAYDVEPGEEIESSRQALISSDGSCGFGQLLVIAQAQQWAINVSQETWFDLQNGTWKGVNFTNWFGKVPLAGRVASDNMVKNRLTNIIQALNNTGSINYTITCQNHPSCIGSAARAQSFNGTNFLRFCPDYFNMPLGGPDGQGAAWLHELAHFAGAPGDVYTVASAGALARTNPRAARDNASNYQYYFLHVTP